MVKWALYRNYAKSWDRAGWRDTPQYPGQQPTVTKWDDPIL